MNKYTYFILPFIIIGMGLSIGLVSHLFRYDKADNVELNELATNSVNKPATIHSNTVKYKPEYDKVVVTQRTNPTLDDAYQDNMIEKPIQNDNVSDTIKPWYDDGKPGISRAELDSIHEYQLAMIEQDLNDPDALVVTTAGQPKMTRAELEALHAEQMRQIQEELNNPNAIVVEATDDQPAVTRGELQALHGEQKRQIDEELNDPYSIVIEATDDQPAVTRGELAAMHEEQLNQIRQATNDPDAPATENEDGTIVTNKELADLHAKQRHQILKSQFNGDEIISNQ